MIDREYVSEMRFWPDDLGSTVPVQWYFVGEEALNMPFAHAFYSRAWEARDGGAGLIGEDPATIRPHSGAWVAKSPGRVFCGDPRQWQFGSSSADPIPPINVATGLPCCCGPAPWVAAGGGVANGSGSQDSFYLLQEDGGRILQEDGSGILWQ